MGGMFSQTGAAAPSQPAPNSAPEPLGAGAADILRRRQENGNRPAPEENWAGKASNQWVKFKKDQPAAALALSVLPISGQVTAAADYYDAVKRGDSVDAGMAALQLLPFGGLLKGVKVARTAAEALSHAKELEKSAKYITSFSTSKRTMDNAVDLVGMASRARKGAAGDAAHAAAAISADASNVAEYVKAKQ